jgi:ABC-type transport system involved in multi-copper enzyme maturation permease subunit
MATVTHWLLRTLRWSNSRQSYLERGVAVALLAGVGLLVWHRHRLAAATQVALVAALLLSTAVFLRRGWVKLFGPVLFYDMIRAARRGRYFVMRFLYAGLLFFVLLAVFANDRGTTFDQATAAEAFFTTFLAVQLIAVSVLTPAYVAGSVTEEKERKTLEYLLATDLRNREIVLSKLLSRLANLTLFLLTGLPILSMVQFLGGVDPTLVLIGFALTFLTMLGLGGLSILFSTLLRKSRDAISMTYLTGVAYLALSFWAFTFLLRFGPPDWASNRLVPGVASWTVGDLIAGFLQGNLGLLYAEIQGRIWTGVDPEELWGMIRGYALFHGVLFVVGIAWAVARLRAVALKESQSPRNRRRFLSVFRQPRVGSWPMVWKEVHIDGRFRLTWLGWIMLLIVGAATLGPGLFFLQRVFYTLTTGAPIGTHNMGFWEDGSDPWSGFQREVNIWVRLAGTGVASIALVAVAIRAAGSISGEREKQTLDGLLASPLDSGDIFFGKWVGSVLSVRWLWLWVFLIWGLGLALGGLSPAALPLLVFAWLAYAAVFAQVGLFFSTASRSSMRATVWTLLVLLGVCFGHFLPWMCCMFSPMAWGPMSGADDVGRFQLGLTPPIALGFLSFCRWDFPAGGWAGGADIMIRMVSSSVLGTIIWGMAALFLWAGNHNYFRIKMNRDPGWLTTNQPHVSQPEANLRLAETELAEDGAPPAKPRGAVLLDEVWEKPPPADGARVVLLDETWEDSRAPREDDETGK